MKSKAVLTEYDGRQLRPTDVYVLVRLYLHAVDRAYELERPAHQFSVDDLDFWYTNTELYNLEIEGYISIKNGIITLLKYDENHPSVEEVLKIRNREKTKKARQRKVNK